MSVRNIVMAAAGNSVFVPASPGQKVFTTTTNWTVPAGVNSISMVCVQAGDNGAAATVVVSGATVCRAQNGARIGDGGGDGGLGGAGGGPYHSSIYSSGGGGGAGGYAGNGGSGSYLDANGQYAAYATAGSGGGGGGGDQGAAQYTPSQAFAWPGGGVGLNGIGDSGAAAVPGTNAAGGGSGGDPVPHSIYVYPEAAGVNVSYGGGYSATNAEYGKQGGALSYKNNVSVSPGQVVAITVHGNGGVRIIWGAGRTFPSNASWVIGPARYWRVKFLERVSNSDQFYVQLAGLLFADAAGSSQITPYTPQASSTEPGTPVTNLFDGDASTTWATASYQVGNWTVQVDLSSAKTVGKIIMQAGDNSGRAARAPKRFSVEQSDNGTNWVQVWLSPTQAAWGISEARTFNL